MREIGKCELTGVIEDLKLFFSGTLSLESFIDKHKFLSTQHFLNKVFDCVPNSQVLVVGKEQVKRFPSLQNFRYDFSKDFLVFHFLPLTLIENYEAYLLVFQRLNPGFVLTSSVFSKPRYSITLAKHNKSWYLFRANSRFRFASWSSGFAACYEDGFCLSSLIYARSLLESPGERTEKEEETMKEFRDLYTEIPSTINYLNN